MIHFINSLQYCITCTLPCWLQILKIEFSFPSTFIVHSFSFSSPFLPTLSGGYTPGIHNALLHLCFWVPSSKTSFCALSCLSPCQLPHAHWFTSFLCCTYFYWVEKQGNPKEIFEIWVLILAFSQQCGIEVEIRDLYSRKEKGTLSI